MFARTVVVLVMLLGSASGAEAQRFVAARPGEQKRIEFPDSLVSLNDKCAVAKRKLNLEIEPIYVNQQPVAFCCAPCPGIFSKNPAPYVKAIAPKLACLVNPGKNAVIDSSMIAFVNHDVFFFSDAKARAKFLADPLQYAHHLSDVVGLHRFGPNAKSPHLVYNGRNYYFETAETYAQFQTNPAAYAVRGGE